MKSIWNNTFYNNQPALGWTFDISFDEYYQGDNNENQLGLNRFAQAAVDISIGKRESEYTSVYYAGAEFKKFTRAQNTGTFTIKFNEDKFYTITGILENIYNKDNLNQDYFDSGTHLYNTPTKGTRKVVVKMYDPNTIHKDLNPVVCYEFYDCHIMSIDDVNLSYESTDSITRSATFVYNYMKFIDYRAQARTEQEIKENDAKMAKIKDAVRAKFREQTVPGLVEVNNQVWKNATLGADRDLQNEQAYQARQQASNGYRGGHR